MRTASTFCASAVVAALLTLHPLSSRMPNPTASHKWYAFSVDQYNGAPQVTYVPPPAGTTDRYPDLLGMTPAQFRGLGLLSRFRGEEDFIKVDQAIALSLARAFPEDSWGEGWHDGGGIAVMVEPGGVVSFGNPTDGMDARYTDEEFSMPLAEFLPLWRDWVASRRLYNALVEKHGVGADGDDLPRQFRPAHYPPRDEA